MIRLFLTILIVYAMSRSVAADVPAKMDVFIGDRLRSNADAKEGYHTFRIPALVKAANGDLLAFAEGRRDSEADDGKIDVVMKRSRDNGVSWGTLRLVHGEDGKTTIGNPVPIVDAAGAIHLVVCRNNADAILYLRSDDHGESWSKPRPLLATSGHGTLGESLSKALGNDVKRFGTGPGHGVQLPNGRLIVPIWYEGDASKTYHGLKIDPTVLAEERLTQTGRKTDATDRFFNGILFSDDAGKSWQMSEPGLLAAHETMASVRSDGQLLLNARFAAGSYRLTMESRDGGETFERPRLDKELIDVRCQASLLATTYDGEEVLLFCNPAVKGVGTDHRARLTLRLSRDGGRSWPESQLIHKGPAAYSDLVTLNKYQVGILYECGVKAYHERISFVALSLDQFPAE